MSFPLSQDSKENTLHSLIISACYGRVLHLDELNQVVAVLGLEVRLERGCFGDGTGDGTDFETMGEGGVADCPV